MNVNEYIHSIYNNRTFKDKYGSDILITIILITAASLGISYYYFLGRIGELKKDWTKIRCNPVYMPFAGMINAPQDESKNEYTLKNYNYCTTNVLKTVARDATSSLRYTQNIANNSVNVASTSINSIRTLFSKLRNLIGGLFDEIMGKILNIVIPLRTLLINSKSVLNKTTAIGVTGLYTVLGGALSMNSFIFLFIMVIVMFLILLVSVIVLSFVSAGLVAWIPFVGWILASVFLAVAFTSVLLLVAALIVGIPAINTGNDVIRLTKRLPPK